MMSKLSEQFKSGFLASLYCSSLTLSWTALFLGSQMSLLAKVGRAQAQPPQLPEQCVPPGTLGSRSLPPSTDPLVRQPSWPELLQLYQGAGRRGVQSPSAPPPIDSAYFKQLSQERSANYRLGSGDQILVDVFVNGQRSLDLSVPSFPITPEGKLVMPLLGAISVQDLTLRQVETILRDRLNQFVKNPQVAVSLLTQRPVRVTVTGEVARPGFYPIPVPELPIALSTAQGTTIAADLRAVKIRRTLATGQVVETEVDLLTPLLLGVQSPDLRLEDGDVIIVPTQQIRAYYDPRSNILETYSLAAAPTAVEVTVVGEVSRPGFYLLPPGTGQIVNALQAAGGATLSADLRAVIVCRTTVEGQVIEELVDLYTPIKDATPLPDYPLDSGDAIIIPQLKPDEAEDYDRRLIAKSNLMSQQITVRILSYPVNTVGTVVLPNGSTFIDVLNSVPLNLADLQEIALIRFDPATGKPSQRILNGKMVLAGDVSNNVLLQDNDVIVVNRNLVAQVSYVLNTFTQPFRDVLGFLLFFQQLQQGVENLFGPAGGSSGGNRNNDNDD